MSQPMIQLSETNFHFVKTATIKQSCFVGVNGALVCKLQKWQANMIK